MNNGVSQNTITNLLNPSSTRVFTQDGIEKKVLLFYKNLLGQSAHALPSVSTSIMKQELTLNKGQQRQLE